MTKVPKVTVGMMDIHNTQSLLNYPGIRYKTYCFRGHPFLVPQSRPVCPYNFEAMSSRTATPKEYPKYWLSVLSEEALAAVLPYPTEFAGQTIKQLLSKPMGLVGNCALVFAAFSLSNPKDKLNSRMHQLLGKLGVKTTGLEAVVGVDLLIQVEQVAASNPTAAAASTISNLDLDLQEADAEHTTRRGTAAPLSQPPIGRPDDGRPSDDQAATPAPAASQFVPGTARADDIEEQDGEENAAIDLDDEDEETPEERKLRLLKRAKRRDQQRQGDSASVRSSVSSSPSLRALRDDLDGFKAHTSEILNQVLDAVAKIGGGPTQAPKRPPPTSAARGPAQKTTKTSDTEKTVRQDATAAQATRFTAPAPSPWPASNTASEAVEEDFVGQVRYLLFFLSVAGGGVKGRQRNPAFPPWD